jgi:hypothetical protein
MPARLGAANLCTAADALRRNEPVGGSVRTSHEGPNPSPRTGPSRKDVSEVSEERFRGASVRSLPRPNRQYNEGRVCGHPECETKLSRYNKWEYCWQHEPVHTYIPRGKRRSKKQAA